MSEEIEARLESLHRYALELVQRGDLPESVVLALVGLVEHTFKSWCGKLIDAKNMAELLGELAKAAADASPEEIATRWDPNRN
jgi:hypothetical protein